MNRYSILLLLTTITTTSPGCDPVRTTSQAVVLRVNDVATGKVVSGANVRIKIDFDRAYPLSEETLEPAEKWHKRRRDFWERSRWFSVTTDADGLARIAVEYSAIDRTIGNEPAEERDVVTGKPYLVQIADDDERDETLCVTLDRGFHLRGDRYTVYVIDIGETSYVEE